MNDLAGRMVRLSSRERKKNPGGIADLDDYPGIYLEKRRGIDNPLREHENAGCRAYCATTCVPLLGLENLLRSATEWAVCTPADGPAHRGTGSSILVKEGWYRWSTVLNVQDIRPFFIAKHRRIPHLTE